MTPAEVLELRGRYIFARTVLATAREATTAVLTDGEWEFDWRHDRLFNDRTLVANVLVEGYGRWMESYGPGFVAQLVDVLAGVLDQHEVDEQGDCKHCWALTFGKRQGPCPDALRVLDTLAPTAAGHPNGDRG